MSAPITLGQVFLPGLLQAFHSLHPLVEVDLVLDNRKVDLTSENFDVAFFELPRTRPTTLR